VTLVMYDSVTPANLPSGGDAYLGYVDGRWATYAEVKARFPTARHLSLAVFPQDDAEGCDCENGDLTPGQVPSWVRRQMTRGQWRPVVYASASVMNSILGGLAAAGITRSQVRLLSAHYEAGKHICAPAACGYPQADGTQWTDEAHGVNGTLVDESVLAGDFFDAVPPPPPPPPAGPPYRHLTTSGESLADIATARNTTIAHLLATSVAAYTPADMEILAAMRHPGIPYYTKNP
jgi:hypothetical protein